jgi:hypothetical protein
VYVSNEVGCVPEALEHGIHPFIWLRDVLQHISIHPINKIEELLPQNLPAGRQGWKLLAITFFSLYLKVHFAEGIHLKAPQLLFLYS